MKKPNHIKCVIVAAAFAGLAFILPASAFASINYNYGRSNTGHLAISICGRPTCEGIVRGGKLFLKNRHGRWQIAPDGTWTGDNGSVVHVRHGHIVRRIARPMRPGR